MRARTGPASSTRANESAAADERRVRAGWERAPYVRRRVSSFRRGVAAVRRYTERVVKEMFAMLWIKALHIVFVVTWFAGLFYLPRLFIYHAESNEPGVRAQLKIMQRRLLGITHIGGALALVFGIWTLALVPAYLQQGWLHAKLALVLCLVGYHVYLALLTRQVAQDRIAHSSRWLRV